MKKRLKLRIPETLNEITLGQYQDWLNVATKDSNVGTPFLKQMTVSIMCERDMKYISKITYKRVDAFYEDILKVLAQADSFDNSEREMFTNISGVKCGFIPDFEKMSMGEFADLEAYVADFKTWHKAMAILYRPVTQELNGKYLIEDYKGITNDHAMKDMPTTVFIKALFFLINSLEILGKSLVSYLKVETQANPVLKKISTNDLDGIIQSLPVLSMTQRKLMRLPNLILEQCSHTSSIQKRKRRLKKID